MTRIYENIPIGSYNTFGFNVRAKRLIEADYCNQVVEALEYCREGQYLIIGGGSNILFTGDFEGTIIKPCIKDIKITHDDPDHVFLRAGAGVEWDRLVEYAVDRGWGGLENLSGIPGTAGASPVQNIGAYGAEAGNRIWKVEYVDITDGKTKSIDGKDCMFGYRESIFKHELKNKAVITYVTYKLSKHPAPDCEYADVKKYISENYGSRSHSIGIREVRNAVLNIRSAKLPDPKILGNAGSFFKNPVIGKPEFEKLKEKFSNAKYFIIDDEHVKVPAAWLIDICGFKGYKEGKAGVNAAQPLVLTAEKGATGKDVLALSDKIRKTVLEKTGIAIIPEVNII